MQSHEELLDEARPFCDSSTGEVLQRIPDELMQRLRAAQLARGIPNRQSAHTQSFATWYVFFNEEIRAQVLNEYLNAQRKRRVTGKPPINPTTKPKKAPASQGPPAERGLGGFRRRKKSHE